MRQPPFVVSAITIPVRLGKGAHLEPGYQNTFLQTESSRRDVSVYVPPEWDLICGVRDWELRASAYGLDDAPAVF